jgi:glyoxylase-like metal-dependent hydrolase (beta-lactamase superfamily II)
MRRDVEVRVRRKGMQCNSQCPYGEESPAHRVHGMIRRWWWLTSGVAFAVAAGVTPLCAQSNPYTDSLLGTVRSLAHAVPGELPSTVGYLSVVDDSTPESDAVDGAPRTRTFEVTPVFQIRFRTGWVMVDAGMSHEAAGKDGVYHQDNYDETQAALRHARLIVATHEHYDHVDGVIRSPYFGEVAPRTMLTEAQVHTLLGKPGRGAGGLDSARARRFIVVDYERALPIAPGVVLVRAPGHTPGSQIVYVKLASGRELMLIGDIVWHHAGLDTQHQKPDSTSREMGEDRTMIGYEMAWLKHTVAPAGVALVVSHDGTALQELARRGVVSEGLDLSAP